MRRYRNVAVKSQRAVVAAALTSIALFSPVAAAREAALATPPASMSSIERAVEHLEAFQAIADASNGHRALDSVGYVASADYVEAMMASAGYRVTRTPVAFDRFAIVETPTLSMGELDLEHRRDFTLLRHSATGSGRGEVVAVDLALDDRRLSDSGCQAEDFEAFPAGRIALLQRGGCTFAQKARNAENAGAIAVIVFNQGDSAQREGTLHGDLGPESQVAIPAFGVGFDLGAAWSRGVPTAFSAVTEFQTIETVNVIAETAAGVDAAVVLAGAHLDSVAEGAGINDNASGSAALLAIAEAIARAGVASSARLRFAWWGAEEYGLHGSRDYVEALSRGERDRIAFYLNLDMLGSVNGGNFVLDGDGSEGLHGRRRVQGEAARAAAAEIEAALWAHFESRGLGAKTEKLGFASDYVPFYVAGIPIGGVYSGAGGEMSPDDVALFGGEIGAPRDACYHRACDTVDNVDPARLEMLMQAIEAALLSLADQADGMVARRAAAALRGE